jgi:S1-C subfamily serine protease
MIGSCTTSIYKEMYPTLIDGRYDSEFPYRDCAAQLKEISETVKQITVMTHYKTFAFAFKDSVQAVDALAVASGGNLSQPSFEDHDVSGTGTVILCKDDRIALLTCAHIVGFPDTILTRYSDQGHHPTPFVKSISLKTNQFVFLNEVAGDRSLEILAVNRVADLAIIGQKLAPHPNVVMKAFTYPLGRAKDLQWGSFVYLFGFPAGYRVVTKGIVSLSKKSPPGSFTIDAVISPGASGSPALAIRDGLPNFELVGIVKMIPTRTTYFLKPQWPGDDIQYDPLEPYHGDMFVERRTEIQQGIALAIPAETILSFIEDNRVQLGERGYDVSSWTRPPKTEIK